jgi:hypothetical protein
MLNKRDDTLAAVNKVLDFATRIRTLNQEIQAFKTLYVARGYQANIGNLSTYTPTTEGGAGTVDAAPNTAHPIVGAEISSTDFTSVKDVVLKFLDYLNNVAVTAADRTTVLNQLLAGYGQ